MLRNESQRRAQEALAKGVFTDELVRVTVPDGKGGQTQFITDEPPRAGVTVESLGKLKPAFLKDGTLTSFPSRRATRNETAFQWHYTSNGGVRLWQD